MHTNTTTQILAKAAGVDVSTIRRDIRRGMLRAEQHPGVQGARIPITGKRGANDYLLLKHPGRKLLNP